MSEFIAPSFLAHSNIYEVNLRQYTVEGNIRSFMEHIPRLKEMGVQILWLMPIHPIGFKNRKGVLGSYYSIRDFYDINPEFGTRQDFEALVTTVHDAGMKIIIDWVANHAAWDNVWTKTNPDFFVRDSTGNFQSPYDWTDVIQIDHSNAQQRDAMIKAMKYWVMEFDIDGFRADLAHLTPLQFWEEARTQTETIKGELIWLAETENASYHSVFEISYAWAWMHETQEFFTSRNDIAVLISLLKKEEGNFPHGSLRLFFTSNHDENSWNGTEFEKYGVYANALAVFNFTYRNTVPLIYSGQEIPNLKRLKFFEKDEIAWDKSIDLGNFYKTLLQFHAQAFTGGEVEFLQDTNAILGFRRTKSKNETIVYLNLGNYSSEFFGFDLAGSNKYRDIFSGEEIMINSRQQYDLPPGGYRVLESLIKE